MGAGEGGRGMRRSRPKTFAESVRIAPAGGVITRLVGSANRPDVVSIRVGRASGGAVRSSVAARLGVKPGAAWTAELRAEVLAAIAADKAREYAVKIAAGRPLTRMQVQQKLAQRGVAFGAARLIAEDLAARGIIDESALAEHVARGAFARKQSGKSLVVAKLRRKGVDAKTAQKAADLAEADAGVEPREAAIALARRKAARSPKGLEPRAAQRRVYAFLARRGFDPETCMAAVREAFKAASEDEGT